MENKSWKNRKLELGIYIVGATLAVVLIVLLFSLIFKGADGQEPSSSTASKIQTQSSNILVSSTPAESKDEVVSDESEVSKDTVASVESKASKETKSFGDYITYSKSGKDELNEWYMRLVNYQNVLDDDWTPDLEEVADGYYLAPNAIDAYWDLVSAASDDGIYLWIVSAYRSQETQTSLFNAQVDEVLASKPTLSQKEAEVEAATVVARPRTSEHECGLAIDFNSVEDDFAYTEEAKWLAENAYKYGFILRYPDNKQSITRVIYEPWHYRFVGVKHAERIYKSGYCLEEYIESIKNGQ